MINSHKETVTKEETIIDDIVCNKCGNKIKSGAEIAENVPDSICEDYVEINASFGYFSNFHKDGEKHQFHLCEKCYLELEKSLMIKPKIEYYC